MATPSRATRSPARLAAAKERAEKEWEALPADIRDGPASPDQMMEGGD